MADLINLADYRRTATVRGPEATRELLSCELSPGLTVHAAAWAFAMPEQEYHRSDIDIDLIAQRLFAAGLHYFGGNDDAPAALVLADERKFRACFAALGCKEETMAALGSGILIRRQLQSCK